MMSTLRLNEVATVLNGKTPSKTEQRVTGFPVLKIRDIDDSGRFIGPFTSFVELDMAANFSDKLIREGDTLILNAAHNAEYVASKSFFASGSVVGALATGEWLIVRPNPKKIDAHYLHFWSQSAGSRKHIRGLVKGIHLYPKDVAAIPVALPDLDQQRRTSARLQEADRLRRTRRYLLELSDKFLAAAFMEAFGDPEQKPRWPLVPFGELICYGPQNGIYQPSSAYGLGTRIVRIDSYQSGASIDFKNLKRVQLSSEDIATYGLITGDFLINRVNSRSHLGKSTLISRVSEPTVFESNMMRFRVNESRLLPIYALQFLQTPFLNMQVQKQAKDASNQSSINQQDVQGFAVLHPPLQLQERFALMVRLYERVRSVQAEALRQAEHLFQSLLHDAFGTETTHAQSKAHHV